MYPGPSAHHGVMQFIIIPLDHRRDWRDQTRAEIGKSLNEATPRPPNRAEFHFLPFSVGMALAARRGPRRGLKALPSAYVSSTHTSIYCESRDGHRAQKIFTTIRSEPNPPQPSTTCVMSVLDNKKTPIAQNCCFLSKRVHGIPTSTCVVRLAILAWRNFGQNLPCAGKPAWVTSCGHTRRSGIVLLDQRPQILLSSVRG